MCKDLVVVRKGLHLLELLNLCCCHLGNLQSQEVVGVVPGEDKLVVTRHIHLITEHFMKSKKCIYALV